MKVRGRVWGVWGLLLALTGIAWPGLSRAEGPLAGPEADRPEAARYAIAVTGVKAGGKVDPTMVEGLDQLVAVEAGRDSRVSVIASSDIQAMLGLEAQKQLLGCNDNSACLAELGGALGVDHLLTTEVSLVGKNWLLYVTLLDVKTARVVRREARRPASEDDLVDQTIDAVQAVMRELLGPEGGAVLSTEAPSPATRRSLWPWLRYGGSALGLGVALTGGIAFYGPAVAARAKQRDFLENKAGVSAPRYTVEEARAFESRADLGLGLMLGGVALAAASFALPALLGEKGPDVSAVTITPDGASLTLLWRIE